MSISRTTTVKVKLNQGELSFVFDDAGDTSIVLRIPTEEMGPRGEVLTAWVRHEVRLAAAEMRGLISDLQHVLPKKTVYRGEK